MQVRRVSTVISHTKMQWEKAIEKIEKCDSSVGSGSGSDLKKKQHGKLDRKTQSSGHRKQQSNNTQGAAMHSGLLSKQTH